MASDEYASLERQIRCFVHPVLLGADADAAVARVSAWQSANPDADPAMKERAWMKLAQMV